MTDDEAEGLGLWDSHAHLDAREFNHDREEVLGRAAAAGVRAIVSVGCDLKSSRFAIAIAEQQAGKLPRVFATAGFHPHEASRFNDAAKSALKDLLRSKAVVAVGEIGLDFFRNLSPRKSQEKAFREQLQLALEADLPVVIHDRDAHERTFSILREADVWHLGGVMHCFSGDLALARRYLDMGFHISLAGPVTYPKSVNLSLVAKFVPLEKLLVETDCPYLAPQSVRGSRNEPSYVTEVVRQVASIKRLDHLEVGRITGENPERLFLKRFASH